MTAASPHEASGAACGPSFAANTLASTPKGKQAIASLKVGDPVIAVDPKTGKATTQTVQQVFLNHDTDLLKVTLRTTNAAKAKTTYPALDAAQKQRRAAVASHGSHAPPATTATTTTDETVHTTANHPWLSADRGWVVAAGGWQHDTEVAAGAHPVYGTALRLSDMIVVGKRAPHLLADVASLAPTARAAHQPPARAR